MGREMSSHYRYLRDCRDQIEEDRGRFEAARNHQHFVHQRDKSSPDELGELEPGLESVEQIEPLALLGPGGMKSQ